MRRTLTLLFLFVSQGILFASQQFAVEIYFDHLPNTNKYIFTVMEQVDSISSYTQVTINSNSPAGNITANRVFILPYTPNCASSTYLQIFRSDTINLGAIPPIGYRFGISSCCRLPNIINLSNPGSTGFYVETEMFPVPGETYANSSPRFVNPLIWQRLSSLQNWHQPALDPDGDSIYYSLTPLFGGTFNSTQQATYNTGYAGSTPFGTGASQLFDQELGILTAINVNQGTYALNLQIRSYQNGSLTAVVNRDIVVTHVIPASFQPEIELSNFTSTGSALDTSQTIPRVYLEHGDTIRTDVTGTSLLTQDSVYMGATSTLFPLSLHTVGNCSANCAQFNPNPNLHGTGTATAQFVYVADSTHFSSADTAYQRVIFLAASQFNCLPFQFINVFLDIYLVEPSNVGLDESELVSFTAFPNPATNKIEVGLVNPKPTPIQLINLQGQVVLAAVSIGGTAAFDVAGLPRGIYLIRVGEQVEKVVLN